MNRHEIEELKANNPIDQIMREHDHEPHLVDGDHLTYRSPFGPDGDASFRVDLDKVPGGLFYDCGLGRGGDVITLVTLLADCSPAAAIEMLKERA